MPFPPHIQFTSSTSAPVPFSLILPDEGFDVVHKLSVLVVSRHWQKLVALHLLPKVPMPFERVTLPLHPL